ncbi:MAG: hypothetical protein SGPRY_009913 [Prymnesium sp.]
MDSAGAVDAEEAWEKAVGHAEAKKAAEMKGKAAGREAAEREAEVWRDQVAGLRGKGSQEGVRGVGATEEGRSAGLLVVCLEEEKEGRMEACLD